MVEEGDGKSGDTKEPEESSFCSAKENFKEMDAAESQRLVRGQKDRLDYESGNSRRRRLVKYHDLEQDLLREELASEPNWNLHTQCCCATMR